MSLFYDPGTISLDRKADDPTSTEWARYQSEGWQDPELRVWPSHRWWDPAGVAAYELGGDTCSRYTLSLDWDQQQVALEWTFTPPTGESATARAVRVTEPFPLLFGTPYESILGVTNGQVHAAVAGPRLTMTTSGLRGWVSVADLGLVLALATYDRAYAATADGELLSEAALPGGISELRVWPGRRGQEIGVCLPEQRKLLLGTLISGEEAGWAASLTRNLGPQIGGDEGMFSYPISFDVGPDGRYYVLDAERSCVLVFDRTRKFLTRWGTRGSGPGEFDFGKGDVYNDGTLGFGGSILVGEDGAVYVADPWNRRIQKFAP